MIMKIKEILKICSRSKKLERGDSWEQPMILGCILCSEGSCWNNWQDLNPVSGHKVCRSSCTILATVL